MAGPEREGETRVDSETTTLWRAPLPAPRKVKPSGGQNRTQEVPHASRLILVLGDQLDAGPLVRDDLPHLGAVAQHDELVQASAGWDRGPAPGNGTADTRTARTASADRSVEAP